MPAVVIYVYIYIYIYTYIYIYVYLCGTVYPMPAIVGAVVPAAVCRWGVYPLSPGVRRCLSGVNIIVISSLGLSGSAKDRWGQTDFGHL